MPYWSLFYHFVWATKEREPLLVEEVEESIYRLVISKAETLSAAVIALNGTENHVHLIASVPPTIAVADFVGKVKGFSSARFNRIRDQKPPFFWQSEYGAFTFDRKRLPDYIAYVQRQKQHHEQDSFIPILERTEGVIHSRVSETPEYYAAESESWRREMLALYDDRT